MIMSFYVKNLNEKYKKIKSRKLLISYILAYKFDVEL